MNDKTTNANTNDNNDNIKQIQFSADFIKAKQPKKTRKKSAPKMSTGSVNTIKNNLIQRIQSHKMDEMGEIEKIHSDAATRHATRNINTQNQNYGRPFTTNHLEDAMSYLSKITPHKPLNQTIKQHAPDPPYGVLKGGAKPLYRNWVNKTIKHSNNHMIDNTNNIQINNAIKITRNRKMTLGKNKINVGVLIKNAKSRKDIIRAKSEIQNANIHDIKTDLFKKGIIRTGSVAPDDMLKSMYESSILTGYVTNTSNMYQNALDEK